MKLEVGKKYRLNNGEEHVCESDNYHEFAMGRYWYNADGRCGVFKANSPLSVACEVKDEPKLWRDMTDAEKGALLLAHHEGKVIEWVHPKTKIKIGWDECDKDCLWDADFAYRIKTESSFLPLEDGKTYRTAEKGDWECIHVDGKYAWLKRHGSNDTAYVWNANTGFAKCLGEEWDITGLEEG